MVPFRAAAVVISFILAGVLPATAQQNTPVPTRRFEAAPCPFTADEKVLSQVRCGYLVVPENRAEPDRRQLRLAVAIAKSASATPRPDPVVLLSGGPGDSLVQDTPRLMNAVFDGLRAERDLIVWDQRGTGRSDPAFCPELNARWREITLRRYEPGEQLTHRRQAVAECREAMLRQGVDLSQYNTVVAAQDLEDLRQALGFAQWNLMAVSYGTRVALEAMRLAPQGIRSAVLTSPTAPPNPPMDGKEAFADVVRRLARACAAQPDCNAAYPDVEQTLWAGMKELEQKPFVRRLADGTQDVIDGNRLLQAVREAMRSRRSLALVPMIVGEFRRRNELVIAALTRQTSNATAARVSRVSRGLNLAVGCHDFPTESPATDKGLAPEILEIGTFARDERICSALHTFRAGPQAPVVSDVPTLLRTGEFDAVTHRSFGPALARTLRHSQVVETPGAGHGEGMADDCSRAMVHDFITNPLAKVDTRCLSPMPPLRFVTDVKAIAQ